MKTILLTSLLTSKSFDVKMSKVIGGIGHRGWPVGGGAPPQKKIKKIPDSPPLVGPGWE